MYWLKALHIIFVVCWFAGLFYLPRIFVYYAASESQEVREQLAIMARRLYRFITPFMFLSIIFGLGMIAWHPVLYLKAGWLWVKLGGVAFLVFYHVICGHYVAALNSNTNMHGHVFYRFFNEVPVIFLFAIVLLAVLKPF